MLIIGFLLLIVGADLLVRGSSNIAKKFHISEILIGLTIVAVGTSMPELIITISSAQRGSTDLIIGNAIGSNICNLLLIMSIMAILRPIKFDRETKIIHLPVALISTLVILGMGLGILGSQHNVISKVDGIILVALYLIYFIYPIIIEIRNVDKSIKENNKNRVKLKEILHSIFFILIGVELLKYGGDLVVDKATEIAMEYGITERVIGLTIVAIGTALPEFITSIMAVIEKDEDLATGNLIGSCILNSFLILGVGAVITPLTFSHEFINNLILLTCAIILIWIFCFIGKKNTLTRIKALPLLALFIIYMIRLFR